MKNEQIAELLYQALETERGGIEVSALQRVQQRGPGRPPAVGVRIAWLRRNHEKSAILPDAPTRAQRSRRRPCPSLPTTALASSSRNG